jgi:predicted transposase YbfD/YdcC
MQSSTGAPLVERPVAQSLAQHFSRLTDQRARRGVRYSLAPLLVLLVLAKLCGADTPQAIAEWVGHRADWLRRALGPGWKRMPHPATWRRVLARATILPEFEHLAGQYLASLGPDEARSLNLDGKALRGTIPAGQSHGCRLLAVQQAGANAVLAQTALAARENEISAAKRLLKVADLRGRIVTGDAIFAQRELSRQVVERGGDYLWKVKQNQGAVWQQLADFFGTRGAPRPEVECARSLDKGHGRVEERELWVSSRLADRVEWPYLSQAFCVRRTVTECRTQKSSRRMTYGLTSLQPMEADAGRLLELTRGHWGIENGLHYRRDVTFKEDACRMKSHAAAQALAVCNNLALGLLRHAGWDNAAEARRFYDADPGQALRLIVKPPD